MFCVNCGNKFKSESDKFCSKCGQAKEAGENLEKDLGKPAEMVEISSQEIDFFISLMFLSLPRNYWSDEDEWLDTIGDWNLSEPDAELIEDWINSKEGRKVFKFLHTSLVRSMSEVAERIAPNGKSDEIYKDFTKRLSEFYDEDFAVTLQLLCSALYEEDPNYGEDQFWSDFSSRGIEGTDIEDFAEKVTRQWWKDHSILPFYETWQKYGIILQKLPNYSA